MNDFSTQGVRLYKVRLGSGRVVGPVGLDKIRQLIRKKHIEGAETARLYPDGEWLALHKIPDIADILLEELNREGLGKEKKTEEEDLGLVDPFAATMALPEEPPSPPEQLEATQNEAPSSLPSSLPSSECDDENLEPTRIQETPQASKQENNTLGFEKSETSEFTLVDLALSEREKRNIGDEKTIFISKSNPESDPGSKGGGRKKNRPPLRTVLLVLLLLIFFHETFFSDDKAQDVYVFQPIRPMMPAFTKGSRNSEKSQKVYEEGIRYYILDTVADYQKAAEYFSTAASLDMENVRALAMLASAYLNLIDSSNKDENYFSVISSLIERSRAKSLELPETVISDVEFYVMTHRPDAAQNRIVGYTKRNPNFGHEMFYYLSYAFFHRGNFTDAAAYLNQYPEQHIFSPKIYLLRGEVAESLGDLDSALVSYQTSLARWGNHAKSHLGVARVQFQKSQLGLAKDSIFFLAQNRHLLDPPDQAKAMYYYGKWNQLEKNYSEALKAYDLAVRLDPADHHYLLEYYALLGSEAGSIDPKLRSQAQMFHFLSQGQKWVAKGEYEEALNYFLQARQANSKSAVPFMKMGDMFYHLNDMANARLNYEGAAELAPKNKEVWSKYTRILIESYEWDKTKEAMNHLRKLPDARSSIDKLAGDMYARQGIYSRAIHHYREAMSQSRIDSGVYISYAEALAAVGRHEEAPFFFALALRFDPLNTDAIIGSAKSIAATESINEAISMLQDELNRLGGLRAEIFTGIAELHLQRGDLENAERFVKQGVQANSSYARPWLIQGRIYQQRQHLDKEALDKALLAYQSYSDRNASDPTGYLERYKIFIKKAEFEKANLELNKIFGLYPKFPGLHYYKGFLYAEMGNFRVAAEEYRKELENHPDNVAAMIELGKVYLREEMANEALGVLIQAMHRSPSSGEAKHQAGYANYLLNNFQAAIALYQASSELDRGNPELFKRMGMAYRAMGDETSARQAFRRYLELAPDAQDRHLFQ
jgi:tetratricopeptide (TPR) repeat protein